MNYLTLHNHKTPSHGDHKDTVFYAIYNGKNIGEEKNISNYNIYYSKRKGANIGLKMIDS